MCACGSSWRRVPRGGTTDRGRGSNAGPDTDRGRTVACPRPSPELPPGPRALRPATPWRPRAAKAEGVCLDRGRRLGGRIKPHSPVKPSASATANEASAWSAGQRWRPPRVAACRRVSRRALRGKRGLHGRCCGGSGAAGGSLGGAAADSDRHAQRHWRTSDAGTSVAGLCLVCWQTRQQYPLLSSRPLPGLLALPRRRAADEAATDEAATDEAGIRGAAAPRQAGKGS